MRKHRGFTLIELLLVTAIVLGLGIFSFTFYARFLTQNGVSNATDQLVQSLRKAQSYAMMSRKSSVSGWGVAWNSPEMVLYQGATYPTRNPALDEKFTVANVITVSGLTDINFSRINGKPTVAGGPVTNVTITVTGQGTSRTININSAGTISR